jgi:hypothetical protein
MDRRMECPYAGKCVGCWVLVVVCCVLCAVCCVLGAGLGAGCRVLGLGCTRHDSGCLPCRTQRGPKGACVHACGQGLPNQARCLKPCTILLLCLAGVQTVYASEGVHVANAAIVPSGSRATPDANSHLANGAAEAEASAPRTLGQITASAESLRPSHGMVVAAVWCVCVVCVCVCLCAWCVHGSPPTPLRAWQQEGTRLQLNDLASWT